MAPEISRNGQNDISLRIPRGETLGGNTPEGITIFPNQSPVESQDSPKKEQLTVLGVGNKPARVTIIEGEALGAGTEGKVTRVTAIFEDAPDEHIQLASKVLHEDDSSFIVSQDTRYRRQVEGYNLAFAAGLPVPETFLPREDRNGFLSTDLTEGGQNLVISEHEITLEKVAELYQDYPEMMQNFSDKPSVQSADTSDILQKASDAQLELQTDTWFLIVKPDGSSDIIVGDFWYVLDRDKIQKMKGDLGLERMDSNTTRYISRLKDRAALIQLYRDHPETVAEMFYLDEPSGEN